jgi:hypothetical protein
VEYWGRDCDAMDSETDTSALTQKQQDQEQHGRPCSPPAAELQAKAQFKADREEWLAQRRAGGGIQATVVQASGGFLLGDSGESKGVSDSGNKVSVTE